MVLPRARWLCVLDLFESIYLRCTYKDIRTCAKLRAEVRIDWGSMLQCTLDDSWYWHRMLTWHILLFYLCDSIRIFNSSL